jgi:8-oxo-dGTP pyrophosphatase MutT (NUDIX family)
MKKYKSIAIPVSFHGDKPRFLTVRDRRFKEWIFVTGGCRKREIANPLRCALRELEEETRGIISLKSGDYTEFKFTVKDTNDDELIYNVFIFFVPYKRYEQIEIISKFNNEKIKTNQKKIAKLPIKKTFDENDYLSWDTLEEFNNRKRWELIVDNIIKNPKFYSCVSSQTRKTFNIK